MEKLINPKDELPKYNKPVLVYRDLLDPYAKYNFMYSIAQFKKGKKVTIMESGKENREEIKPDYWADYYEFNGDSRLLGNIKGWCYLGQVT